MHARAVTTRSPPLWMSPEVFRTPRVMPPCDQQPRAEEPIHDSGRLGEQLATTSMQEMVSQSIPSSRSQEVPQRQYPPPGPVIIFSVHEHQQQQLLCLWCCKHVCHAHTCTMLQACMLSRFLTYVHSSLAFAVAFIWLAGFSSGAM